MEQVKINAIIFMLFASIFSFSTSAQEVGGEMFDLAKIKSGIKN